MTFWPWWLSAITLGAITTGFWLVHNRPLGVSGSWARLILRHYDKQRDQAESPFRNNPELLKDALMEATIEEFGEQAVRQALATSHTSQSPLPKVPVRTSWTAHLSFLVMLVVGGLIASIWGGDYQVQFDLGEIHRNFFGAGISYWFTLLVGGAMIGFGTQLSGGCTSGHALSGCSRLVPASLIATVTFFASAVVTSILISYLQGGS